MSSPPSPPRRQRCCSHRCGWRRGPAGPASGPCLMSAVACLMSVGACAACTRRLERSSPTSRTALFAASPRARARRARRPSRQAGKIIYTSTRTLSLSLRHGAPVCGGVAGRACRRAANLLVEVRRLVSRNLSSLNSGALRARCHRSPCFLSPARAGMDAENEDIRQLPCLHACTIAGARCRAPRAVFNCLSCRAALRHAPAPPPAHPAAQSSRRRAPQTRRALPSTPTAG